MRTESMSPGPVGVEPTTYSERRKWVLYVAVVLAVVALDVVTKLIAQATLPPYQPLPVWGDFFRLTYIYNPGAAFGMSAGGYSRFVFGLLAVVAVVILFFFYRSTPPHDRLRLVAVAAVTGGALGNLIDRVRSPRGVVDFLDFGIGTLRWPVFNVADMAVVCGVGLLLISLWNEDEETAGDGAG